MLHNAGNKIALWAKVVLYAGIALSVIGGLYLIINGAIHPTVYYSSIRVNSVVWTNSVLRTRMILFGVLVMLGGSLSSWLCALLLQAFGDLAMDTKAIRQRLEQAPVQAADEASAEIPVAPDTQTPAKTDPAPPEPEAEA